MGRTLREKGRRLVESLLGDEWGEPAGVIQTAAVWHTPAGGYQVLGAGAGIPRCDDDRLALGIARASADAIITTGQILRDEPALQHTLHPDPAIARALMAWREQILGRNGVARTVVLTRGVNLPLDHPLMTQGNPWVVAPEAAFEDLELPAGARAFGRHSAGLRDTVRLLMDEGCRCILVEAGPSTAWDLYEDPPLVDRLILTVLHADAFPASSCAGAFVAPERVERVLGPARHRTDIDAESGAWSINLYGR